MKSPGGRWSARLAGLGRRPLPVLSSALLLALAAAALDTRLALRTSITELLPTDDPAVVALERTKDRIGDLNLLLVGIRSPDRTANLRYAESLTRHLAALPPTVCEMVAYHVRDLLAFLRENRWLYLAEDELADARDRLRRELLSHKNPFSVDLSDDGPASAQTLLAEARNRQQALTERFPDGYFVRGDYAWVATLPAGGMVAENAGEAVIAAVRAFVADNPPHRFHPQMTVQPAGPVQSAIQNREAVERDIISVTVLCLVLIGASIALYFRSFRWLLVIGAPAALGTLLAFSVAELAFGYLNASTAFLGSIILGNGINYAIVLGARYRERRDGLGETPEAAMAAAIEAVWRGTLTAAAAAAVAHASLMFTSFRGFSQFGLMGAVGCLVCWMATFILLPPLVTVAEGRGQIRAWSRPPAMSAPARFVAGWPRTIVGVSVVFSVVAALGLRHFASAPFEYDFRKLSTDLDRDASYRQFDQNLDALFGTWHSPTVLLADRLEDVEPMRAAIRRRDRESTHPGAPFIGRVVTVYDVLPGTPESQRRKLALLSDIRRLAEDPAVHLLDPADRRALTENTPPATLRELLPADLPPLARRPFSERDGTVGRVLLAYHDSPRVSMWRGEDLLGIASVLEYLDLGEGRVVKSSGPPMIFGAMLRSILHDGPLATGLSLSGVLGMVLLLLRPLRAAGLAVCALVLGVLWMVGAAGLVGIRITFLNFIALPITFGIGVEYAINVVTRLKQEPVASAAVASTGGAVALCSWTTIVGYGSLLAASSQALRGFGAMAILGEAACLLAALLAVPALVSKMGWHGSLGHRSRPGEVQQAAIDGRGAELPGQPGQVGPVERRGVVVDRVLGLPERQKARKTGVST